MGTTDFEKTIDRCVHYKDAAHLTEDEILAGYYCASGWYFWDETWANVYGPFDTKDDAVSALIDYCERL